MTEDRLLWIFELWCQNKSLGDDHIVELISGVRKLQGENAALRVLASPTQTSDNEELFFVQADGLADGLSSASADNILPPSP